MNDESRVLISLTVLLSSKGKRKRKKRLKGEELIIQSHLPQRVFDERGEREVKE